MHHLLRARAQAVRAALAQGIKKIWPRSHFAANRAQDLALLFSVQAKKKLPGLRQWRYLTKFYNPQEILATKIFLFFLLSALLALGVNFYYRHRQVVPTAGGQYVEAVVGAPNYINPLFNQANGVDQDLTRLIFSSLLNFDAAGGLALDLAESYAIDEKQTTYTFTLKPNLVWHDGEPLTALDVVFTVQSIQDKNFKSPLYGTFRNVTAAALDERRVSFTLPESFAPFLSTLTFGILPAHRWQEIEPNHALLAELNLKPVGAGPYQFAGLTKDKKGNVLEYRLKRFKSYYGGGPFIENVVLKFFSSPPEALAALQSGNADGLGLLAGTMTETLTANPAWKPYSLALPQYVAIFFNQNKNPALSDKAVRQALLLATNREAVITAAFPGSAAAVADPLAVSNLPNQETLPPPAFAPEQAEQLLDSALWKKVAPETAATTTSALYSRQKKINSGQKEETVALAIKLTTIQKEENIRAAETIRELWQAIGVKVDLEIVEAAQIQKEVIPARAYEALLFGQILGGDPDPYPFWHSSQINDPGLNLALYANKEADKLLEEARGRADTAKRAQHYLEFEKKLREDVPAIFLYSPKFTYLLPTRIKGMGSRWLSQSADRFNDINNWYIKTKKRIKF